MGAEPTGRRRTAGDDRADRLTLAISAAPIRCNTPGMTWGDAGDDAEREPEWASAFRQAVVTRRGSLGYGNEYTLKLYARSVAPFASIAPAMTCAACLALLPVPSLI